MEENLKQLLLKDLCARLPYGVICKAYEGKDLFVSKLEGVTEHLAFFGGMRGPIIENIKPYLRPMSSMTEEEENEYRAINCYEGLFPRNEDALDYVLSHHLDFRCLIPMGLALEAPDGMYKTE